MFLFPEFPRDEVLMKIRILLFLFLPFTPGLGQAQSGDQSVSVTLSGCMEAALKSSSALRASRARVEAAEGRTSEVRSALFPQFRFSGRFAKVSEVPEFSLSLPFIGSQTIFPSLTRNYSARLSLQQTLFSGFRLSKTLEAAEHQEEAVRREHTRDQGELVLNVAVSYWNLYRASRVERVLAQSVDQVALHLKDVESFRKQGMATDLDVLKVQTQFSDIRVRHIEAQGRVRLSAIALNSLIGLPLQTVLLPADDPAGSGDESFTASLTVEQVMQAAREKRNEVAAVFARRETAKASVVAARGGWYPQLVLSANYDYARPNPRVIPPKDAWEKSWDIGLSVQWSIWDWFATAHQTTQAEANLSLSEASLTQVSDAVSLEAAQDYFKMKEAKERVVAASLGLQQAEENYRITAEKFKGGASSNTDLLDAEMALLQARLNETQALVDITLQTYRLKRSMGAPLL